MPARDLRKRYPLERIGLSPSAETTVIAAFVGILAGFGDLGFKYLIGVFQSMFWGATDMNPEYLFTISPFSRFINPVIGGLIVGLMVYFLTREVKGDGVSEVMVAVATKNSIIRPIVVLVESITAALSIGSGGSVGREGPIVRIGAAIASTVGQAMRLRPEQMKTIVGCGVAAGISATFNAPIAGTLFALELIVSDFGMTSFTPIIVAAVTSTSVTRYFHGNTLSFYLPHFKMATPWELFIYLILGIFAGLTAYIFTRSVNFMDDIYSRIKIPEWSKAATGGAVVGLIALQFPHIMGVGYEVIGSLFEGKFSLSLILFLVVLKIFATSVTVGSGGSGGVFSPSLYIGAMLGGAFGTVVNMIFPNATGSVGAYALVGMAAVNGACTLAPLSAIIILVELTDNYTIILPLMLTVVISSFVMRKLSSESIYTWKLARRGIKLHHGEDVNILKAVRVNDVIRQDETVVRDTVSLQELLDLVLNKQKNIIFITDVNNHYEGVISLQQLKHVLSKQKEYERTATIDGLIEYSPSVSVHDGLDYALNVFGQYGYDRLPVVDDDNTIVGSIILSDIITQYNREVVNRNIAFELGSVIHSAEKTECLKLSGDVIVTEIMVPSWMNGKSVNEIGLRKKYGISVFLINEIRKGKEPFMATPSADYILHEGDTMLVSGREADIENVLKM